MGENPDDSKVPDVLGDLLASIERHRTYDIGYVHVLTEPGGQCRDDCPHPRHQYASRVNGAADDVNDGAGG